MLSTPQLDQLASAGLVELVDSYLVASLFLAMLAGITVSNDASWGRYRQF